MRRWLYVPALLAFLALAGEDTVPTALAQDKKHPDPEAEQFVTADGIRLKGLFHRTATPQKGDPIALLLYAPDGQSTFDKPGDWAGLTKTLNDEGFHVFRFDWRGHGKSDTIVDTDKFWSNAYTGKLNQNSIKDWNKKPAKSTFDAKKDFKNGMASGYFPAYLTDLAAVRFHLDAKNDAGAFSTSSIYVIGSGDAATLGICWMATEWYRPAIYPNLVQLNGAASYAYVPQPLREPDTITMGGSDFAAGIWLSASLPKRITEGNAKDWTAKYATKLRANNRMVFMYGADDKPAETHSHFFFDKVLVGNGNAALGVKKLEYSTTYPIKGSKLNGVTLLGNDKQLGTETQIVKYLTAWQKERATVAKKERKYPDPYFINYSFFVR